ncbi:unnamed protein product [Arabis nemorensis]|uniref:Uncharacterized protein n=1 Tax=Arabis nemorensis TaxID=586526 RepID=A0A565CC93_9BRAS|nr:unnamed protein product [Arabis nemorensis]
MIRRCSNLRSWCLAGDFQNSPRHRSFAASFALGELGLKLSGWLKPGAVLKANTDEIRLDLFFNTSAATTKDMESLICFPWKNFRDTQGENHGNDLISIKHHKQITVNWALILGDLHQIFTPLYNPRTDRLQRHAQHNPLLSFPLRDFPFLCAPVPI